ncbi:MAG: hypothetical protein U0T82_02705 [Bacteroidales bacterium]
MNSNSITPPGSALKQYQKLLEQYSNRFRIQEKLLRWLGLARLTTLVAGVIGIYRYFNLDRLSDLIAGLLLLGMFVLLVTASGLVRKRKKLYNELCTINRKEIDFLEQGKQDRENGAGYLIPQHPYAADLDIFGNKSLFHYLNRTVTRGGEMRLAEVLNKPDKKLIRQNQEAVQELQEQLVWRQLFLASGVHTPGVVEMDNALKAWKETGYLRKNKLRLLQILAWGLPLFTLASIALAIAGVIDGRGMPVLFFLLNLVTLIILVPTIRKFHKPLEGLNNMLSAFSSMLNGMKEYPAKGERMKYLKSRLGRESGDASAAIKQLGNLLDQFDSLGNILAVILVDGIFLYHLHGLIRLMRWKNKHENEIPDWLNVIYETDLLCSLSNYAFNNPENTWPEIADEPILDLSEASHPLLPAERRVANSISFGNPPLYILTGSNMAGKSTFLRTVGINMVMACAGLPVCAGKMVFYPFDLLTSMRIGDSLAEGESLFFAELKRLQTIMTHIREGNQSLVLLDEILRGTNSDDKYKGTSGYIKQLLELNSTGILATNDLKVTGLAEEFKGRLKNICFEVEVTDTGLYFDYRLKDGVCSKLSASYLMQQMKII